MWSEFIYPRKYSTLRMHFSLPVLTLREIAMVDYMEDLTDIPGWWKKVSRTHFYILGGILVDNIDRFLTLQSRSSGRMLP